MKLRNKKIYHLGTKGCFGFQTSCLYILVDEDSSYYHLQDLVVTDRAEFLWMNSSFSKYQYRIFEVQNIEKYLTSDNIANREFTKRYLAQNKELI